MFKSLMIIMKKELRRVFTDRRLVITNFILPMVSIALVYSIMGFMIGQTTEEIESHVTKVQGINVPSEVVKIINDSETMEFTAFENTEKTPDEMLLAGDIDYYLAFDSEFATKIEQGAIPEIVGKYSPKSDVSMEASYKISVALEQYRNEVLVSRLGDAQLLQVYALNATEIEIPAEEKGIDRGIANLVPMLVSIFIFAGAMGIGMDSIAGEKERGTIATMLLTPVDRGVIIGGKVLSLSVVALISMVSSFVGVMLSIPFSAKFLSTEGSFDMSQIALGGSELAMFLICMIGMVGMYVTIISVLSMIANSLKEAGAYITPAYMVVMITAFMNMFGSSDVSEVYYYVPVYNNLINMKQILLGNGSWMHVLVSFVTSAVITLGLLVMARSLMHKEKVVFPS